MPRVPTALRVERSPLPGVRVSPQTPAGAFGVPSAGVDLSGPTKVFADMVQQEREKADQLAVLDADNKLAKLQTDLHTQATSRQGVDALGASADVQEAWEKGASEIGQSIRGDRAKEAFLARRTARFQSLYSAVEHHAQSEYRRFAAETTKVALDRRYEEALTNYTDLQAIDTAVNETRAIIADEGRREGWTPEMIGAEQAARASRIHVGIVSRMLAKGDDITASNYYAKVQSQVLGSDAGRLEQELDLGSVRGESQRRADMITAGAATFDAAMSQVRAITDPKVRDATEERVRRFYSDKAQNETRERYQAYIDAGNIVAQTGDTHKVPPSMWLKLSPPEQRSLQEREDQLRHPKRQTDMGVYATLMNMAGLNPQTRQDFEQMDLTQFYRQLNDTDFERLVSLQLQLRNATQGADRRAEEAGEELPDRSRPADVRLTVPPQWLEAARTNPRYKAYLQHMGVFVPAVPLPVRP